MAASEEADCDCSGVAVGWSWKKDKNSWRKPVSLGTVISLISVGLQLALLRVTGVDGKIVKGNLATHERWHFLDRFCFLSQAGMFSYEIEYDSQHGYVSLLLYPDLQWANAYNNPKAKTCHKKLEALSFADHQRIILMPPHPLIRDSLDSGCEPLRQRRRFKLNKASNDNSNSPERAGELTTRNPSDDNDDSEGWSNSTLGYNFTTTTTTSTTTTTTTSTTTTAEPEEEEETITSTRLVCNAKRSFRSARERWWFISVSSCNNTRGLDIKYKFKMTNGYKGDYWYEHFSADEFYILPILTGFLFIYIFLLFSAILFAVELKCRQLLHVTYKLFMISIALQNAGIIALCISYGSYASNGLGLPNVKLFGRILEGISEFIFMLLLLLLAKGYTVTRGRLRVASAIKLTLFNCLYIVIYALLFLFEQYTFDPGLVLYIYESPAGYGILILRIIGWFLFVYAIFFTLKHYPEKSSFYLPFFGIYSLWFLSGPVVILISNHAIDKWVREKVAISIQHFCMFCGHVIFLMLTRPSAANKSFPYHVRTTQVGANSNESYGNGQMDHFDSHCYAPTYVDGNGRTVDIFTVTGVLQRSTVPNGTGPNLDVFNVNGPVMPASAPPSAVPALFPMPPPKYTGDFPHEEPGQVEEMLKEPDDSDLDTDRSLGSEAYQESANTNPNANSTQSNNEDGSTGGGIENRNGIANGVIPGGGGASRATSGHSRKDRSNVYMCNNNDE